jgi:hypothetical protein
VRIFAAVLCYWACSTLGIAGGLICQPAKEHEWSHFDMTIVTAANGRQISNDAGSIKISAMEAVEHQGLRYRWLRAELVGMHRGREVSRVESVLAREADFRIDGDPLSSILEMRLSPERRYVFTNGDFSTARKLKLIDQSGLRTFFHKTSPKPESLGSKMFTVTDGTSLSCDGYMYSLNDSDDMSHLGKKVNTVYEVWTTSTVPFGVVSFCFERTDFVNDVNGRPSNLFATVTTQKYTLVKYSGATK